MEHFFPRFQVEACDQMHTRVKLLEGMQMNTILKLLGGYSQIIGGIYPFRVSAPLAVYHLIFLLFLLPTAVHFLQSYYYY